MMQADIRYLLITCKIFGFIPFEITNDTLRFSWRSKQFLFFSATLLFGSINIAFITYSVGKIIAQHGFTAAIRWFTWVAGYSMPVFTQLILIQKREKFISYLERARSLWVIQRADKRFHVTGTMWIIHCLCGFFGGFFLLASTAWLNWKNPHAPVFHSSMLCPSADESCHCLIVIASMMIHSMAMFYGYLGFLILDMLPLGMAIGMTRALSLANEHLKDHVTGTCTFYCKVHKESMSILGDKQTSVDQSTEAKIRLKISAIRQVMGEHLQIQRCLQDFNSTFCPYIIFSIMNLFAFCALIFFSAIKMGIAADLDELLIYICNGIQFFLRGILVLNAYGNINSRAMATRDLLYLDLSLLEELHKHDPSIVSEVHFFASRLDSVTVSAGMYFSCTHTFLMNFFGLLITYVILLVQSV